METNEAPETDRVTLPDLTVALTVRVAQRSLTLGEIGRLDAGHLIDLHLPAQPVTVDLLVGADIVARGRLVATGDGLAVQILDRPGDRLGDD